MDDLFAVFLLLVLVAGAGLSVHTVMAAKRNGRSGGMGSVSLFGLACAMVIVLRFLLGHIPDGAAPTEVLLPGTLLLGLAIFKVPLSLRTGACWGAWLALVCALSVLAVHLDSADNSLSLAPETISRAAESRNLLAKRTIARAIGLHMADPTHFAEGPLWAGSKHDLVRKYPVFGALLCEVDSRSLWHSGFTHLYDVRLRTTCFVFPGGTLADAADQFNSGGWKTDAIPAEELSSE